MKLTGILLLAACLHVPVIATSQTLTFSGKDIPLTDVFKIIKCQTGVVFFYDTVILKDVRPITIKWKNALLENALNDIFKDFPLTWMLEGKTVTIFKKIIQKEIRNKE